MGVNRHHRNRGAAASAQGAAAISDRPDLGVSENDIVRERDIALANHAIKFWRHDPPSALHRARLLAHAIEVTEKRRLELEAREHMGILRDSA